MLSYTEENYLKTIFLLSYSITNNSHSDSENNNANNIHSTKEISTNDIATRIDISAASVTDMLKKLSKKELIKYTKYHGVSLTEMGRNFAIEIIRRHRLWETFLVVKLNFNWSEIHDIAEQLEHISSPKLIEKLDAFLNYPRFDPHGEPIPDANGNLYSTDAAPMQLFKKGDRVKVIAVGEDSSLFLEYLDKLNINIGTEIRIIDKISYDLSMQIIIDNQVVAISKNVSEKIYVKTSYKQY